MESASQKDITDVMSFQLHVHIETKINFNHFPLIEIMIVKSFFKIKRSKPNYFISILF